MVDCHLRHRTSIFPSDVEVLKSQKADILIGTQMIAKGLDFPNVTLVGVVNADTALNIPDFRAAEKNFPIINTSSRRAGRGDKAGEVIYSNI